MPGSEIIQSLATGLDVLTLLAAANDGLRVKDVAEKAQIKPSVAHNVLRTLRVKGFVERDVQVPVYRLGPRVAGLVRHQDDNSLFKRVETAMGALLAALPDATVTFTRAVNGEIIVERRLNAQNYGIMQKPAGFSLGLYSSASGLAIMAFSSEECYLALQQHHPLMEEATHIWSPPEAFDQCLKTIRNQGYAVHPHTDARRLAAASPLYDANRQFAGVIGVSRTAASHQALDDAALAATLEHLQAAARLAGSL